MSKPAYRHHDYTQPTTSHDPETEEAIKAFIEEKGVAVYPQGAVSIPLPWNMGWNAQQDARKKQNVRRVTELMEAEPGLTPIEIAKRVGLSVSTIREYRRGMSSADEERGKC